MQALSIQATPFRPALFFPLLFLASLLFGAAPASASTTASGAREVEAAPRAVTVSGLVTSSVGVPLVGASVVLRSPSSGLARYGGTTAPDGQFMLSGVEPGRYELRVTYVGFATVSRLLDVPQQGLDGIDIIMAAELVDVPEVVVSFRRLQRGLRPVTIANMDAAELDRSPSMKDLPVLLSRKPSITFHSENGNGMGYSTLRMRGFGQRRIAIAINGIPQNDPEDFNVFWINFFDIQGVVEDIQIQRGAGASFYGSTAIGGAINIRAMPYRPNPYARVEVGGGSFNTRRYTTELNSGLISNRLVLFGRLSRLLSDGYRDWSYTEFWRFFAGATLYGDRSTLTVQAYGGPQKDGLAYSGIPKAANDGVITDDFGSEIDRKYNFSSFAGDVESFHQPHVELHHTLELSPATTLEQSLFWVKGEGYFDFGGTFRSANYLRLPPGFVPDEERDLPLFLSAPSATVLFRAYLDQWQVGWIPRFVFKGERLSATAGLEARLHRSHRWGRIQEATGIPADLVGSQNDVRVYSFRSEKKVLSGYLSTAYDPAPNWTIQTDLQLTWRTYRFFDEAFFLNEFEKPYLFANPRVGVAFRPVDGISLYSSVAYARREPRMKSLYDGEEAGAGFVPAFELNSDGSLDVDRARVRAEGVVDLELGGSWTTDGATVSANIFYMDFDDEIVPSGGLDQFGVPRSGNAERTVHSGIELEAAVGLYRGLSAQGNATISRNRFKRFTEFVTAADFTVMEISRDDQPIAGFPDESANLGLLYVHRGLSAELNLTWVGASFIDNSGGTVLNEPSADGSASDALVVDAYSLVDATAHYDFPDSGPLGGLRVMLSVNNILDARVLQYGNVGPTGAQFFPAATRHVFMGLRYTVD